jgi:hypothetical protein
MKLHGGTPREQQLVNSRDDVADLLLKPDIPLPLGW